MDKGDNKNPASPTPNNNHNPKAAATPTQKFATFNYENVMGDLYPEKAL